MTTDALPEKPRFVACEWCGLAFTPDPRPQAMVRRWCSHRCRLAMWENSARSEFTGRCAACGKVVEYPRKLCSIACRTASSRTGRTLGRYTCAGCGKEVLRSTNDARRQKYCSHACEVRHRVAPIPVPDLDPAFGNWLAGFIDGEGCFMINVTRGSHHAFFALRLRDDDRPVLEEIQRTLGFGGLFDQHAPSAKAAKHGAQTVFYCRNLQECTTLAAVLRQHPLRAKKARDFAIWAEFIDLMNAGCTDKVRLADYAYHIRAIRKYPGPRPRQRA